MSEIILEAQNVWKEYRLGEYQFLKHSKTLQAVKSVFGLPNLSNQGLFWALQDVSFQLERGEILALLGRNGAGKTTLLRLLSAISRPTRGRIRYRGKVASLIGIGTGFHPDLTGRENVYLNGAILGMRRRDITRNFDAIIDFCQLERFVDTPVKRYSSGMYMRLGFAIAAFLDADILVVDEVLAVGDVEFQQKCIQKMRDVVLDGRTVLLVSHDLHVVSGIATKALLMQSGRAIQFGNANEVIEQYINEGHQQEGELLIKRQGSSDAYVDRIALIGNSGTVTNRIHTQDKIRVEIDYEVFSGASVGTQVVLAIANARGVAGEINSHEFPMLSGGVPAGRHKLTFEIENVLRAGHYLLHVYVQKNGQNLISAKEKAHVFNFEILRETTSSDSWIPYGPVKFNADIRIQPLSALKSA